MVGCPSYCLAIVKGFGVESRAFSFPCSGNDQRVIDGVAVLFRNFERRFVHFNGDGQRRRTEDSKASSASVTSLQDIRILRRATEASASTTAAGKCPAVPS
jgi:hypothetical protein